MTLAEAEQRKRELAAVQREIDKRMCAAGDHRNCNH